MDIVRSLDKSKRKHFQLKGTRIQCTLTGHELPPSNDALLSYANGKKFERALAQHAAQQATPADNLRFLIDASELESQRSGKNDKNDEAEDADRGSSSSKRLLFCRLTCRFVADTPADIRRHLAGRRFRAALAAYRAARIEGRPFTPNTSLYAKYRGRFQLDGLQEEENGGEPAMENSSDSEDTEDNDEEDMEESETSDVEDAVVKPAGKSTGKRKSQQEEEETAEEISAAKKRRQ